jgi:CheY-like chemotaxis protein
LAGGVAHDFNNMLSVILGHAELGLMHIEASHPVSADLKEISKTAERSADLTRQLLAFARKQTIAPKVINLNGVVSGTFKMLQRLIGEDITLTLLPSVNLWPVKMDSSQIDQILANLCVNARDAIEDIGSITIETENCTISDTVSTSQANILPGKYVKLSVSDNGGGMDKETLAHVFEPFYTTKEFGKGTGLGLATVYGAVKQNNGYINIYSELGIGTTFTIYLPSCESKDGDTFTEVENEVPQKGNETILLVEDEPAILNITTIILSKKGYNVLAAETPGKALQLAREHTGVIHLLMTDVVMPEMNGRDLAKNMLSIYPGMKRLFMSGYTADVIAHHGVLDEGVHFIQKPFNMKVLAEKLREVLDS